ncbi:MULTISPECIES: UTRA domain-containing protein [Pseudoalteromonas]|uniref:UTRA domain-containing protein n=1 Tax=Pseudoalteromonas obscura TaxID=3048491 RepID=A0ABT7EP07_9GAMM|nr:MULTISPECIES: UTRA domain-containing protein [Pseudoalteromonas]MBQ4834908.1 UTRA domain-containing protein [Pseudoalteromonas luteoviolacea]MDK2596791.1 UTRA domain-containing protein [Pseudoalteromonas sp. P94(2023)]
MSNVCFAYVHVREAISQQIIEQHLTGSLPSERELCATYDVARSTLRQALGQLEHMGLIYRKNRSGWFVCPRKLKYDPMQHTSFLQYTTAQGFQPSTKLVEQKKQKPCKEIAAALELDARTSLTSILRVRSVDGRAVVVENLNFSNKHLPDIDKHDLSLSISILLKNTYHQHDVLYDVTVESCCLFNPIAQLLDTYDGALGLKVTRIVRDKDGIAFEFDREFWRHDALMIENKAKLHF